MSKEGSDMSVEDAVTSQQDVVTQPEPSSAEPASGAAAADTATTSATLEREVDASATAPVDSSQILAEQGEPTSEIAVASTEPVQNSINPDGDLSAEVSQKQEDDDSNNDMQDVQGSSDLQPHDASLQADATVAPVPQAQNSELAAFLDSQLATLPGAVQEAEQDAGTQAGSTSQFPDATQSTITADSAEIAAPNTNPQDSAVATTSSTSATPDLQAHQSHSNEFPYQSHQDSAKDLPPASFTNTPLAPSQNAFSSPSRTSPSTALASDPSVAYQTAQSLLARKPNTLSRLARLRQRVEKDKFDGEAWLELITDAVQKGDLEKTREVYEGFLKSFPDNAREWIAYADLELSHGNNERVNAIFGRCLRNSPSVQLWQFYLTYIRRTNPIDRSSPERALPARDVITKAFEFSLAHVGQDIEAGTIWHDYIEFLKEGEVSGTWEAQQKMDKLRQTYQRAVCIPLGNLEQIWRDYDMFENNLNRTTAKRFLQDRSPAYMTARASVRQIQSFLGSLTLPIVPHRPNWYSSLDRDQIRIWKSLLAYEESDPMELADPATIRTRMLMTYKKAIGPLRFYPEIWYMAANYARKNERSDEASFFFKSGMEANPTSLLLHYAYIEAEESKGSFEECHRVYNGLVERLQSEIDSVNATTQKDIEEALQEKARVDAEADAIDARKGYTDEETLGAQTRNEERENIRKAITDKAAETVDELKRLGANVWIMQMRFARRAEGIQAARSVFSKARKWAHITWQVFEASAMLELHWNKEAKIATNVFEVGLKRFNEEVGFVTRYLDFLITINDDGNARALFERAVAKIPPEKARELWKRWAEHEYLFGDLTAIQKLDSRLAEVYPDDPPINRFVDRHTYLDLDDLMYRELGQDDHADDRQSKRASSDSPTPAPSGDQQQQTQLQQQPPLVPNNMLPMPPIQGNITNMPQPNMQFQQNGPPVPPMEPYGRNEAQQQGAPYGDDESARRNGRRPAVYNKRQRSPSPPGKRTNRRGASPPRVSRHTPPEDFPEAIPWLLSQLPSKTVFAAHGPILDWQHLLHLLTTVNLPPPPQHVGQQHQQRGRDRSISPRRRNPGSGRRRSPDYGRRR